MRCHINPCLVNKRSRTCRIAELPHRGVNIIRYGPFFEKQHKLIEHWGQYARCIKTWPVLYDNACFSLRDTKFKRACPCPLCGLWCNNYFKQRHFGNGREVVHPDNIFRPAASPGYIGYGNCRGIGGEYGFTASC